VTGLTTATAVEVDCLGVFLTTAFAAVARFTVVFLAGGFLAAALGDFLTAGWGAFMGFLATGFLAGIGQTPQRGLGFH